MSQSASTAGRRVVLALAAILIGFAASALIGGAVVGAAGWDFDVPSGPGDDFGRVAGQWAAGAPLDHNRVPLVARVLLAAPLWLCLVGVPFLLSRRHKLDLRRDLGWGMTRGDAGVGLAVGIATQVVLVPLVYLPLSRFIDSESLEAPARNLVASADSPVGIAALLVLTVVGAPIAEEFLYRGLLHRGLADLLSDRGRRVLRRRWRGPLRCLRRRISRSSSFRACCLSALSPRRRFSSQVGSAPRCGSTWDSTRPAWSCC